MNRIRLGFMFALTALLTALVMEHIANDVFAFPPRSVQNTVAICVPIFAVVFCVAFHLRNEM